MRATETYQKLKLRLGLTPKGLFAGEGVHEKDGYRRPSVLHCGWCAIVGFAVAGCAEPSLASKMNVEANHNHTYKHYAKHDFRELEPGEPGNCAAIAYTKQQALKRVGVSSTMVVCKLKTGDGHAFLLTSEGVLDNRFDDVMTLADVGCVW